MPDSPRPWWTRRLWWLIAALVLVGLAVAGWLTRAQPVAVFTVSAQPLVRMAAVVGREFSEAVLAAALARPVADSCPHSRRSTACS